MALLNNWFVERLIILWGAGLVAGFLIFWKIPMLKSSLKKQTLPLVSIVVPARNEVKRLPQLLASLAQQSGVRYELIVIDDDSEDATSKVAERGGANVFRTPDKKEWRGKSDACYYGALKAKGDWLLFLDADVSFKQESALENLLSYYQELGGTGILSVQPFHTTKVWFEQLSAFFNVLSMVGMNVFTPFQKQLEPAGAFGPVLMVNREEYFSVGGHQKIREAVMDDLELGQLYLNEGYLVRCMGGKGSISFRMYPEGLKQLIQGWTKSFGLAAGKTHPAITFGIGLWILSLIIGFLFPVMALFHQSYSLILIGMFFYFLNVTQCFFHFSRVGEFSWQTSLIYPVYLFFFLSIFLWALIKVHVFGEVEWRGRKHQLED